MIKLTDKYYMTADSNQYILIEKGQRDKIDLKTKKPTDKVIDYEDQLGFYITLSGLIKGCLTYAGREKAATDEFQSLKELIDYLSDLEEKILDATKGF